MAEHPAIVEPARPATTKRVSAAYVSAASLMALRRGATRWHDRARAEVHHAEITRSASTAVLNVSSVAAAKKLACGARFEDVSEAIGIGNI